MAGTSSLSNCTDEDTSRARVRKWTAVAASMGATLMGGDSRVKLGAEQAEEEECGRRHEDEVLNDACA